MESVSRIRACVAILALALVVTLVPAGQVAHAADDADRSAAGSVVMPADNTLEIKEGVSTKINFGTTTDYQKYFYFKIKPSKGGYIQFTDDYTHGSNVALCNAKKKVISRQDKDYDDFFSAGSPYKWQTYIRYGVKKGTTYYIRVKGTSTQRVDTSQPYIGTVKWTNKKIAGIKYGKTKKKAVVLKKKKTRNGVIVAGNKKAQWYKIKSKQKKTKIILKTKGTNGYIRARVYYKSYGKWYSNFIFVSRTKTSNNGTITSTSKKNTYYVKVYPENTASGTYSLTWK